MDIWHFRSLLGIIGVVNFQSLACLDCGYSRQKYGVNNFIKYIFMLLLKGRDKKFIYNFQLFINVFVVNRSL